MVGAAGARDKQLQYYVQMVNIVVFRVFSHPAHLTETPGSL